MASRLALARYSTPIYIRRMSQNIIYPIRLSRKDRLLFRQAAKAQKKSVAEWLRETGRRAAARVKRRAACLDYPDWPLSEKAERDKDYLRKKFQNAP
jgi:hypothetical protein